MAVCIHADLAPNHHSWAFLPLDSAQIRATIAHKITPNVKPILPPGLLFWYGKIKETGKHLAL
jgi:hypothetical protein